MTKHVVWRVGKILAGICGERKNTESIQNLFFELQEVWIDAVLLAKVKEQDVISPSGSKFVPIRSTHVVCLPLSIGDFMSVPSLLERIHMLEFSLIYFNCSDNLYGCIQLGNFCINSPLNEIYVWETTRNDDSKPSRPDNNGSLFQI